MPEASEAITFLARMVRTLDASATQFEAAQAWVQRMAPRQHEAMWQQDVLAAVLIAAYRPQLQAGTAVPLPPGLDLGRMHWLIARERAPQPYVVQQRGPAIFLEADSAVTTASALDVPGSPLATLQTAAPYVQIQSALGTELRWCAQALDRAIALPPDGPLRLATDFQELTIDSLTRPEWAQSIGRDAQGLFVTWADGRRCAYWMPPGQYPVYNGAGTQIDTLELTTGYWADETEALDQWHSGFRQPSWAENYGRDACGLFVDVRLAGVLQRLRWIVPGEFTMGSPDDEAERGDDERQHRVILTRGFWLAETTCTQALWQAVMGSTPSHFTGAERPVENVSWDHVQGFIARLNAHVASLEFRLPTEAEWEYACRAGTTTPFWFGAQLTPAQVNYYGAYSYARGQRSVFRAETVAVKALPCNAWGLYQMHGNVWEWCQDWYGAYPTALVCDPVGPARGALRILRGGGWIDFGRHARSAQRGAFQPDERYDYVGFRLARGQVLRPGALEERGGSRVGGAGPLEGSAGGQNRPGRRRARRRGAT